MFKTRTSKNFFEIVSSRMNSIFGQKELAASRTHNGTPVTLAWKYIPTENNEELGIEGNDSSITDGFDGF